MAMASPRISSSSRGLLFAQFASVFAVHFAWFGLAVPGLWHDGGFPEMLKQIGVSGTRPTAFADLKALDGGVGKFAAISSLLHSLVVVAGIMVARMAKVSALKRLGIGKSAAAIKAGAFACSLSAVMCLATYALAASASSSWFRGCRHGRLGMCSGMRDYASFFFEKNDPSAHGHFARTTATSLAITYGMGSLLTIFGGEFHGLFPNVAIKVARRCVFAFLGTFLVFRYTVTPEVLKKLAVRMGYLRLGSAQGSDGFGAASFATYTSLSHTLMLAFGMVACYLGNKLARGTVRKAGYGAAKVVTIAIVGAVSVVMFVLLSSWLDFATEHKVDFVTRYHSAFFDAKSHAAAFSSSTYTLWFLAGAFINEIDSLPAKCASCAVRTGIRKKERKSRKSKAAASSAPKIEKETSVDYVTLSLLMTIPVIIAIFLSDPTLLDSHTKNVVDAWYAVARIVPGIWERIYDNYSKNQIMFMTLGVLCISEIPLYFFSVLDYLKLKSIEKYRLKYSKVEKKRPRLYPTNEELWRAFKVHCQNFFGVYCLTFVIGVGAGCKLEIYPYKLTRELPDYWFVEFIVISFVSDSLFYWLHRLVHHPRLYPSMHKMHHEWIYSISLAHHYMSMEEALLFMIPPVLPPMLFGTHIAVMWLYMFWVQLNAILGHSAYMVPVLNKLKWLPFLQPAYHDLHHLRFNVNYGATYPLTDMIYGTYRYEPIIYVDGVEAEAASCDHTQAKRALPGVKDDDDPFDCDEVKTGGYALVEKAKAE